MVQKWNNLTLEIILVLLSGNSHLREIARTIKKPHSTVLRVMNDLAKKRIIDYTLEGKNKKFFITNNLLSKNYIYSAEIYKLSKLIEHNPELGIIFDNIKKNSTGMVILFGSYAKGKQRPESDIDIYIETREKSIQQKIKTLHSKVNVKIGPFDQESLLIKEIIKTHVIIRGVEEFYERLEPIFTHISQRRKNQVS